MDISIIIPTYNRLWSLPKAISSCYDPLVNIEVIVIDDGSTDGTWEWLSTQTNIIAIKQDNQGKDCAVNNGFKLAKGKYVRFLDSDDWLLPSSSALLFAEAERSGADVVCAGYKIYNEDEKLIKEIPWTTCDDFIAQQLGECDSSHYSAYLFKKDFINHIPHRQQFGALDDRQFIVEVALNHPQVSYIKQPALAHRVHNKPRLQTDIAKQAANNAAHLTIFKQAVTLLQNRGELTQRRKNACCNSLWHLAHWIAVTDIKAGHDIYNWVYLLNADFAPAENLWLARLYRIFGFKPAEKLLRIIRIINSLAAKNR